MWNENISDMDRERQGLLLKQGALPKHIAVIMDGNGRWAKERNLPRVAGHKQGIESLRDIVKACSQIGVKFLTVYAFSIENWNRPATEVSSLMHLLEIYLRQELDELHRNNVRLLSIGKLSSLPKRVQKVLLAAIERTKHNDGLTLALALSYSGRWDIVRAVQMLSMDVRRGKVSPEDINEELFSGYLTTHAIPDPDLLIRTSGEMRLSNFLLWEMAYGEMYITNKFWPEFRREDLYEAIENYYCRERRFGKTSSQVSSDAKSDEQPSYIQRVVNALK